MPPTGPKRPETPAWPPRTGNNTPGVFFFPPRFQRGESAGLHKSADGGGVREFSGKQRVMPEGVGFPLAGRLPASPSYTGAGKKLRKRWEYSSGSRVVPEGSMRVSSESGTTFSQAALGHLDSIYSYAASLCHNRSEE